jgi:hypothetical protein
MISLVLHLKDTSLREDGSLTYDEVLLGRIQVLIHVLIDTRENALIL